MRRQLRRELFRGLILGLGGLLLVGCAAPAWIPLINQSAATPLPAPSTLASSAPPPTAAPPTVQVPPTPIPPSSTAVAVTVASETASKDKIRVQNTSSSLDNVGRFHLVGEIANDSESTIYDPAVVIEFRNAAGETVGVQTASALVRMLEKGEKGPFVMVVKPPTGWVKVAFSLNYETSSPAPPSHALQFSEQSQKSGNAISVNPGAIGVSRNAINVDGSALNVAGDSRLYVGKVTNHSLQTLHFTTVILTGYDASGKVVRTAASFVGKSGGLASGATAPYQLTLSSSDAKAIASVAIIAEGEGN
jgi:hypothetical protein